ncbi:MAG: hypothetical protein AAGA29_05890 [Planctomycetota bacterium]
MAKKKSTAKQADTPTPTPVSNADERVEIKVTAPTPPDRPRYKPGMRIRLTRGEISEIGLPADTYEVLGE